MATKNVKAIAGAARPRLTSDYLRTRRVYHEQVVLNNIAVTNQNTVTVGTYQSMARNPTIKMGIGLLKAPVRAAKREIIADTPKVQAFLDEYITPQLDDITDAVLQSMEIGFSVAEMLWKPVRFDNELYLYPYQFEVIDPTKVTFLKFEGDYAGIRVDTKDVDGNKTLYAVWDGKYGNLYGIAITRPSFEAWRSLQFAQLNADRHFEQQGSPAPRVYYPDDVDEEGSYVYKADAEGIAQNLSSSGAVVIPKKAEENEKVWEIDYLSGDTSGDNFISYMNYLDTLLLRGILIPDGAATRSGSETGSYAERGAAVELLTPNLQETSDWVDRQIQTQVVDRVVEANFENETATLTSEAVSKERIDRLYTLTEKIITSNYASNESKEIADTLYAGLAADVTREEIYDEE